MEKLINFTVDNVSLSGNLVIPQDSIGLVIFAHGSGSSRFSPRNNFVARELQKINLGTLLIDLLTENEDENYTKRFDINLIATRLIDIINQLSQLPENKRLPIGLFGASTGAAAALITAAKLPNIIAAVVSRGGRPDLTGELLHKVNSSTLLIVGSKDFEVIKLNQEAFNKLSGIKKIEIVEGATHLFEEVGTLEEVTRLASIWLHKYLLIEYNKAMQQNS